MTDERKESTAVPDSSGRWDVDAEIEALPDHDRAVLDEVDQALDFGLAVHAARTAKGWTQQQLALAAGMKQSNVSQIERAGVVPTLALVKRLAKALGVRVVIVVDEVDGHEVTQFTLTPRAA
ncbi:helix-turn-helix domain-containing protein [Uniformispora flossi]|uniref:helix-turn-helix domain-containing protein n=1 Tax=Uniformispora flossi TaxID=3390723 RepID=UPI003C2C5B58